MRSPLSQYASNSERRFGLPSLIVILKVESSTTSIDVSVARLVENGPFLPSQYSIDFFAAAAVTGSPSLNLASLRSVKVTTLLSGETLQDSASAGSKLPSGRVRTSGS